MLATGIQCRCGPPPQQRMQDDGFPLQSPPPPPPPLGLETAPAVDEANTENFFSNRVDPHFGQRVPFQSEDRTNTSLSWSHAPQ